MLTENLAPLFEGMEANNQWNENIKEKSNIQQYIMVYKVMDIKSIKRSTDQIQGFSVKKGDP